MAPSGKYRFAIDRGGTFTDVWYQLPSGNVGVMKLLSEDPQNYEDAPREAIKRIIEEVFFYPYSLKLTLVKLRFVIIYLLFSA